MADVFSLAPNGSAWADDAARHNPATQDDYGTPLFSGGASAFFRGAAEGAIGLAQSAVSFDQRVLSDPSYGLQLAPTATLFRAMFPTADTVLQDAYDSTDSALRVARDYVKPDAGSQGIAAQVLHGLGQFTPAIAGAALGGPVVGGATAFGSTYEQTRQDFIARGVSRDTANTIAFVQGGANAIGMGMPAAMGGNLLTRLASGVGINTSFGAANRFAVGEILDQNGHADLAKQYRAWDGQAMLIDGVLGAAFGGAHHLFSARGIPEAAKNESADTAVDPTATQNQPNGADTSPQMVVTPATNTADPVITYESRLAELQAQAAQLLPVGDRKVWQSEVANGERILADLRQQRADILSEEVKGSGKALARGRADKQSRLRAVDEQITYTSDRLQSARDTLEPHMPGGEFFNAKADLSRLEQGIIPESMQGLIREADIRPSDIDAAHALNEGLHYDIESSPVLHTSNDSINSHVAAMDEAARQLMAGQPVNVDIQSRGLDGIMRPDLTPMTREMRTALESLYRDNGIVARSEPAGSSKLASAPSVVTVRGNSAFSVATEKGIVSVDPETGVRLSSNSFDLMQARDLSQNADMTVFHPDTGQEMTLADALADMDRQIETAQKESTAYNVAAACFLRNPG